MEYRVNGVALSYEPVGACAWGEPKVLLDEAIDITAATAWTEKGFVVEKLFTPEVYTEFSKQTRALLLQLWREAGLVVDEKFPLENYHTLVPDFKTHLLAVEKTKLLNVSEFPIAIRDVEERISELCRLPLVARNPYDNQSVFHFRVIRPQQADNNPLHRDVWLEDYDDCINLYIPVAGSDASSSLILVPGSHRWPESRIEKTEAGAHINGVKFNVPAVTDIRGDYVVERPDPKENEVLVFSPYLIHGGAVNLNKDHTRISIEMRLWKR